jgi:hypothetical protein
LSWGTAGDLAALMSGLARGSVVSPAASARVDSWLATGVDLSMVASGFDLDPLAHTDGALRNKDRHRRRRPGRRRPCRPRGLRRTRELEPRPGRPHRRGDERDAVDRPGDGQVRDESVTARFAEPALTGAVT